MYRGKFENNPSGRSTSELLEERASRNAASGRTAPAGQNRRPQQPRPSQSPEPTVMSGAAPMPPQGARHVPPQNARPVPPQGANSVPPMGARPVPPQGTRPVPPQSAGPVPPQGAAPVPQMNTAPAQQPARPAPVSGAPEKSHRKVTKVFYSFYFGFIALFALSTFFGLHWLNGWLERYEAAQPDDYAEAVFQQLFENPNWGLLYDNSVTKGTDLEGKEAYVAHMQEKVGSNQLTYQETSAGLSGNMKYFVKLGDENIASFMLQGDSEHITDNPNWHLGDIELIFRYDNSYKIQVQEGHKAYVNNMELDESYTIMKASSVAQDFLPVGTTGIRVWTQQIDNLMGKPTVKILDEKGQEMHVSYNPETKTFTEQTEANTITEDQKKAAIGAAEVYGKYMISQANRGELAKYFDASSDVYTTIRTSEKIVQQSFFQSFDFGEETVSDFTMYSDDLFSCHVYVVLNVTRKDGTVKEYPIDTNFFFAKQNTGKWLAYDMTNEPVLEPVGQVRLTFMNGSEQISTGFYDTDATELDTPLIAVPQGKVFSGWTRETLGAEGQKVLEVMFTPDETGHVVLPLGSTLEPMVLTALFENAPAEGGNE